MFLKVHKTFKRATDMNFKIILPVWPFISDLCHLLTVKDCFIIAVGADQDDVLHSAGF